MELKVGYKLTEYGAIPDDWEILSLGSVAFVTKLAGYEYSKYFNSYKDGGEIIVLRGTNITNNVLDLTDVKTIPSATSNFLHRSKLSIGDLVFAYVGTIGPVYLVGENNRFHLGPNTSKITANKGYSPEFLYNYFKCSAFRKEIAEYTSVGAQPSLSMSKIRRFKIILPWNLKEQTAIANALSDADALINSLEKLIAKKRKIKQGAMQKLLEPKDNWEFKTYGQVFEFLNTATYSRAQLQNNGEIGYVHYGDIHTKWDFIVDLNKASLPTVTATQANGYAFLKDGDLIMADASEDYSGIGKCVEVKNLGTRKVISGLHTFLLRDKNNNFVNGFKGYLHTSKFIKSQFDRLATGMKVYGVSKNNLKNVVIPIPSEKEQRVITDTLTSMELEILTAERKLEKYKLIKQGMMQSLLTGKIRLVKKAELQTVYE